ncbi:MAG: SixA phosphatase family protein [Solirubrobacteraceae bacterium]
MAAQLWLLRHGEAEPHGTRPDELRELTERGERQASAAGRALAALDVRLDSVLASPRVRALDTAKLACQAFPDGLEPQVYAPLSAGFDGAEALRLLGGWTNDAHMLLVGHDPDFSSVVHELTGARVDLKKGGMAMVRLDSSKRHAVGNAGELIVLARPRELALIAGMAVSEV